MHRAHRLVLSAVLLATTTVPLRAERELPNFDLAGSRPVAARKLLPPSGDAVTSRRADGVPTFLWGPGGAPARAAGPPRDPVAAAEGHLRARAALYGVGPAAFAALEVKNVHDTGRGGIVVVFGQRVQGMELAGVRVSVLMKRDLGLVAIGGAPHPAIGLRAKRPSDLFARTPEQALGVALGDLYPGKRGPRSWHVNGRDAAGADLLVEEGPAGDVAGAAVPEIRLTDPARVWRVLYPMGDELVPAYRMELFATEDPASRGGDAYRYLVSAVDGTLLQRTNLKAYDAFTYRVWAETSGLKTPLGGPHEDVWPHPSGQPDGFEPAFVPSSLIPIEGFNSPVGGGPDPWLPADATETNGNNVDAYGDLTFPDGYVDASSDMRAPLSAPGTFDYTYDHGADATSSAEQTRAAVVNLFYVTNWLHDYFYDSGFDESAGNAQDDNFGRGGVGGDRLRAEAEDYSGQNNADMSTPSDGGRPRMQMYTWSPRQSSTMTRTAPAPAASIVHGDSLYDPDDYDVTAELALANDGEGVDVMDLCQDNATPLTGKIVLLKRGNCTLGSKRDRAVAAGALAMVMIENVPGEASSIQVSSSIPIQLVSQGDGEALVDLVTNNPGAVTLQMADSAGAYRSGGLAGSIVAHEWGHYFDQRLNPYCGSKQCGAMSEGWGDFMALLMSSGPGEDLDGTFTEDAYATAYRGDDAYASRRFPYSVDATKNPLRFRHIADGEGLPPEVWYRSSQNPNSEVHNAGEVWTSMLWEAYVALRRQVSPPRTFDEARRQMADYMVAGLQLAPPNATFTENRDAILAAAAANDSNDFATLADAFALRGLGTCAVPPARFSVDFTGLVEDFTKAGRATIGVPTYDDDVVTCDDDGFLDAAERGTIRVTVTGAGAYALTGAQLTVESSSPALVFESSTRSLPDLNFGQVVHLSFPVHVDPLLATTAPEVTITLAAGGGSGCAADTIAVQSFPVNFDIASSTDDSVEAPISTWTESGTIPGTWTRTVDPLDAANHVWSGRDSGSSGDVQLVSPPFVVHPLGSLTLAFSHRFEFEQDSANWDGGVIEVTTDDGATWEDVAAYQDPGYGGAVNGGNGNVLEGRQAFVGTNPSWPARDAVALSLGSSFAGKTARVRFRIGTDPATGANGWEIDDLSVGGVLVAPFNAVVPDACVSLLFSDGFESAGVANWSGSSGVAP